MQSSKTTNDGNSPFSMVNGDHQGPATMGGKNVYPVTPPNKKQQVPEYHYSTPNQFGVQRANGPEIASQKRLQVSNNMNFDVSRANHHKGDDGGQSKHSGTNRPFQDNVSILIYNFI